MNVGSLLSLEEVFRYAPIEPELLAVVKELHDAEVLDFEEELGRAQDESAAAQGDLEQAKEVVAKLAAKLKALDALDDELAELVASVGQ